MKRTSVRLIQIALGIAAGGMIAAVITAPQPSDSIKIQGQIDTLKRGVESGNTTAVLSVISAQYTDDNFANNDQVALALRRFIPDHDGLILDFDRIKTTVTGDQAETDLHVRGHDPSTPFVLNQDVQVYWKREPAHRLLLLPTTTWRIVRAQYGSIPGE